MGGAAQLGLLVALRALGIRPPWANQQKARRGQKKRQAKRIGPGGGSVAERASLAGDTDAGGNGIETWDAEEEEEEI